MLQVNQKYNCDHNTQLEVLISIQIGLLPEIILICDTHFYFTQKKAPPLTQSRLLEAAPFINDTILSFQSKTILWLHFLHQYGIAFLVKNFPHNPVHGLDLMTFQH